MGFLLALVIAIPYLTIASIDSKNKQDERVKNIRQNCLEYFQDANCYEKLTGINPENTRASDSVDFRDIPRYSVDK